MASVALRAVPSPPLDPCSCSRTYNLQAEQGATLSTKITLTLDGVAVDVTGGEFQFTAKTDPSLPDSDPSTVIGSAPRYLHVPWSIAEKLTRYDTQLVGLAASSSLIKFPETIVLNNPIVINNDDELIDGRNRLQVAWALSLDPKTKRFNPPDVWGYVRSQNFARRHLSAWQKADIARKRANMRQGERTDFKPSENPQKVLQEEAAKDLGTTPHAITQAKVIREWAPDEAEKADRGEATLDSAYKVANSRKKEAEKLVSPEKEKRGPKMIALTGIIDKKLVEVSYPQPKGKHQFNRTNDAVDWASWTWNPVTGCLHGCKYCYAREMAYRDSYTASYPIQFAPLFHHERLDDPVNTEPGSDRVQDGRVFVCSMADLFGEWVPQNWIDAVFDAALRAPEWEYLFLTKFPQRYRRINLPPKAWFGASVDVQKRVKVTEKAMPGLDVAVRWISAEPMLEPITFS